ncbi:Gfo/Idh/MocA family protein [Robiginitalea marina]|uniref:Gfo/Idh/MocA family oxidoreductase n=1 Tax=Robiginitalea marina TaxID=2954105 RepID=A0ABT1AUL1_9FLAO|nr:Gfo/Idh/MocA family oxidoreductase [Robiginitalea marina]MCO5723662.1 Gfo/Idh/MocA family oxidoreductase [Robiginitalea marina]
MNSTIGWGIIGPGHIAAKFAGDLALVPGAELRAVASRDLQKARTFQAQYGALKAYGSYAELFADPAVEVVYIASPHNLHHAHTLEALEAGKHVLCEKPMGINSGEVKSMHALAENKGLFLMEALWSRFNPVIREVCDFVRDGGLGALAYLKADFAFPALDRDPGGRLLNPELAGGSLLDIGIYPVFLAYVLLGVPGEVRVLAHFHETGVEKQIGILLGYPGAMALLYSGFTSRSEMRAEISGEAGNIYLSPRWHQAESYQLDLGGEVRTIRHPFQGAGYTYEIEEVHRCLAAGYTQSPLWSRADSAALHSILDQIRDRAGIVFPGAS